MKLAILETGRPPGDLAEAQTLLFALGLQPGHQRRAGGRPWARRASGLGLVVGLAIDLAHLQEFAEAGAVGEASAGRLVPDPRLGRPGPGDRRLGSCPPLGVQSVQLLAHALVH